MEEIQYEGLIGVMSEMKCQRKSYGENLYRLEHLFQYSDSMKIIRKQVNRYEKLVREQAERMERARRNSEEAEQLQKDLDILKDRNIE
jgi:hypothetical protein